MKLFIKYSVLAVLSLVLALVAYLWSLDINQYKPVLVQAVSRLTGRELQIDGDLHLIPSLSPTFAAEGIRLANAPWSSSGVNMVTVGRIEAKATLIPLLTGIVQINQLILHDTKLSLETNSEGLGNWALNTGPSESDINNSAAELPTILIDSIDIANADIIYINGVNGTTHEIKVDELKASIAGLNTPVSVSVKASYGTYPIALGGTIGSVDSLLKDSSFPLDINGQVSIVKFQAIGTIEKPVSIEGIDIKLAASVENLSDLNQYGESGLPDISPASMSGNLKFSDTRDITIEGLKVNLGQTDLSGSLHYQHSDALPSVSMQLQSGLIDLIPFSKETDPLNKPDKLFSKEPLPLQYLALLNLDMTLVAQAIKTRTMELNNVKVDAQLKSSQLLTTVDTTVAGGKLTGDIKLYSTGPALDIDLTGTGIQLGQLPHDNKKPWFSGGPVDVQIKGMGQGLSVAEIMGSFDGKLLLEVGAATLPNSSVHLFGADILMSVFNSLNPFANQEPSTLLECAVINFDIQNGITNIDRQIAMQTTKMSMVGSGQIDFKKEELSLGIKPYAREGVGISLGSIAGAAKIGGTLANPKPEVDTKMALKAGVTAGAAIATGGLSLLAQGLFNKTTEDPNPCKTALGQTSAEQTQPAAESRASPEENKKGLLDSVKGGIKSLFGR